MGNKAYTVEDKDTSVEYTHYYYNSLGKKVRCYILLYSPEEYSITVKNENRCSVYLSKTDVYEMPFLCFSRSTDSTLCKVQCKKCLRLEKDIES